MDARRKDAISFLRKMLEDNTITFVAGKDTKDWSFNYYVDDAENRLRDLSKSIPNLAEDGITPAKNNARDRWDYLQAAFDRAVTLLAG